MKTTQCFREFAKYSSLNVLGMVGMSCYILADTFFVAKGLGANGLAALNLAIPIYSFIHGSGLMLGMGGATKYAIFRGQGGEQKTGALFTGTVYLAVCLALLSVLTGLFFSEALTSFLGANGEVFDMTNTYLKVLLLFAPAFLMNDVLLCFVRNDGNPGLPMLAMLLGSFSNIVLDYVFIFPMRMGIFGAVLATGLAPLISMGILSVHRLRGKNGFHLVRTRPHLAMIRSALSLGFPSLISEVASGIVIIVFNMILLRLQGNVGVAAYGVIANLSLVMVAVHTGIAQGIQPLISRAYGYRRTGEIRQVLRYGINTVLAVSGVIYGIVFCFAGPIAGLFNGEGNARLQEIAIGGLRLYFVAAAFVGCNIVLSVFFTSTEKALPAHLISLLRGLILIVPMAFLLSAWMGVMGVWLAFPVTEGVVAVMGAILYLRHRHAILELPPGDQIL